MTSFLNLAIWSFWVAIKSSRSPSRRLEETLSFLLPIGNSVMCLLISPSTFSYYLEETGYSATLCSFLTLFLVTLLTRLTLLLRVLWDFSNSPYWTASPSTRTSTSSNFSVYSRRDNSVVSIFLVRSPSTLSNFSVILIFSSPMFSSRPLFTSDKFF